MKIEIPNFGELLFKHLVFDYNGTIAIDGEVLPSVAEKFKELSEQFDVHVITADTFGRATENLKNINCKLVILAKENQTEEKYNYIKKLGSESVVAFGNGRNDCLMLKHAKVGIAVLQNEGCATQTLMNSDIVVTKIDDALDLFLKNLRLKATLRG